jgi:hypothetical protein
MKKRARRSRRQRPMTVITIYEVEYVSKKLKPPRGGQRVVKGTSRTFRIYGRSPSQVAGAVVGMCQRRGWQTSKSSRR